MWLVGVVVRRYIDILIIIINFPYILTPLVLGLFLAAASLLLCSFLKCFFGLVAIRMTIIVVCLCHSVVSSAGGGGVQCWRRDFSMPLSSMQHEEYSTRIPSMLI